MKQDMEGINNFDKGLHSDSSPLFQPEGTYRDALNWVRNDDGQLFNELIDQVVNDFSTSLGTDVMGTITLNNDIIFLFPNEIRIFNKTTLSLDLIYSHPDLNIQPTVDIEARIGFNGHRLIYFVDGVNPDRFLDLDNASIFNDLTDLNLSLEFKIPIIDAISVRDTGNLPTGTYYIVARYINSANNKTAFGVPSNPIKIVNELENSTFQQYDGADPQSTSSKSISFGITNRDTNYALVEYVVVTYLGVTNQLVAYSLGIHNNSGRFTFSNISQQQDTIDLNEVLLNPTFYETSKHIQQKDNILVRSNLTTRARNLDFQTIANNIQASLSIRLLPIDQTVAITAPTSQTSSEILIEDTHVTATLQAYKIESVIRGGKGFQRGEVYSLAITPMWKDGSLGFAYHIPCNNPLMTYTSNIPYPIGQGYPTGNIRHFKMPDEIESSGAYSIVNTTDIKILNINLSNVVFPQEYQDELQGYIIGYQKRDSSLNRRVVAKGIIRPYNTIKTTGTQGINGQTFKLSPLQGTTAINDNDGTRWIPGDAPCFNMLSPDLLHGYPVNGNKLRITHKSLSESFLTYKINNIDKGIFLNEDATYRNIFTPANTSLTREQPITTLTEIPQIPGDTKYVLTSNSRTFEYSGTKPLVHIETQDLITTIEDNTFDASTDDDNFYYYFQGNGDTFYHPRNSIGAAYSPANRAPIYYGEIINELPNQYGDLENAEYSPLYTSINFDQIAFDIQGDTYIEKYGVTVGEQVFDATDDGGAGSYPRFDVTIYFWMESTNLLNFRHFTDNAVPYYPKYKTLYNKEGDTPIGLHNIDINKPYASGYNKQYSLVNDLRRSFPKPTLFEEVTEFPNRSIFSEKVFEGELADQFRVYLPNNFHDIPKNKGEITDTFVWDNKFFHHTEHSLWQSYFNDRTAISSQDDESIQLGDSGVFRLPSKEIFPINGGYCGTTSKCGYNTPFGRIFIDNHQSKVFMLDNQINEISDQGLFNYFREFINTTDKYNATYDYVNKRLLLNRIGYNSISYHPKSKTWVSKHALSPDHYITLSGETYAIDNQKLLQLNLPSANRKTNYITLVFNKDPLEYKVFDTMKIGQSSNNFNPLDTTFDKSTFSIIQAWNEYQNTGNVTLVLPTDFASSSDYTNHIIKFNKDTYDTQIPLDLVINPYNNIFDIANLDNTKEFKQRMKSQYLVVKLDNLTDKFMLLNYIRYSFRKALR